MDENRYSVASGPEIGLVGEIAHAIHHLIRDQFPEADQRIAIAATQKYQLVVALDDCDDDDERDQLVRALVVSLETNADILRKYK